MESYRQTFRSRHWLVADVTPSATIVSKWQHTQDLVWAPIDCRAERQAREFAIRILATWLADIPIVMNTSAPEEIEGQDLNLFP